MKIMHRRWQILFLACLTTITVRAMAEAPSKLPSSLPEPGIDGTVTILDDHGHYRPLTINGNLQNHLTEFLKSRNHPIASVVIVEAKTGKILAMAQGRSPGEWNSPTHTALYNGFPAASLFKTVVAATALELAGWDENESMGLAGGCSRVSENGAWLNEQVHSAASLISMTRAFGKSCNGYFAKVAVNHLGLGPITAFAKRFGWGGHIDADFQIDASPIHPPTPENSSAQTIGKFAAGFGQVGISAMHAAWLMLALANDGVAKPLQIFADVAPVNTPGEALVSPDTARRLRAMMEATTRSGTATTAFGHKKYRGLKELVGGKTGTLNGQTPKGLTTWFTGMMPLDNPEIIVASVVILGDERWLIKGSALAAEAFWAYHDLKQGHQISSAIKTSMVTHP